MGKVSRLAHQHARRWWLVGLGLALTSCDREPPGSAAAIAQAEAVAQAPFVVFTVPSITIDRVGATVPVPAIVGSTISPETIESSAPEVVTVTAAGGLHAVGEGRAVLRARDGSGQRLEVEVRAVGQVRVVPDAIELAPGDEVQLGLLVGEESSSMDARKALWSSNAPGSAIVIEGRVQAGSKPGTATISAEVAGQVARATVLVGLPRAVRVTITPARPIIKVGEVVTFGATGSIPLQVERWTAGEARLLHQTGPATFVGIAPGQTSVCGEVNGPTICTEVTVHR
jgi:hypothetical protein